MSDARHNFYKIFGLVQTPKNYLYLDRTILFQINLGIHPSNTGDKLV